MMLFLKLCHVRGLQAPLRSYWAESYPQGVCLPVFSNQHQKSSFAHRGYTLLIFYQEGKFPLPLANIQAFRSRKVGASQREQLVILMPQGCSCPIQSTVLYPPLAPLPQSEYLQGEPR